MVAISKEQRAEARAAYIKSAKVTLHGDYAEVVSQTTSDSYEVEHNGKIATNCECDDRYYRQRTCKHMEAVTRLLSKPAKKARRSALNEELVASFQLPEGVAKMRKVRGQGALAPVKVEIVYFQVGERKVSAPTAAEALLKALKLVKKTEDVAKMSSDCPASEEYLVGNIDVSAFADDENVLPELPPASEVLDFDEDEEFSEDLAEIWTQEEIAAIRKAAVITAPKIEPRIPQAPKVDYSQRGNLNGNHGFSLLRR
jgi:uncharacterized Zn finger protein